MSDDGLKSITPIQMGVGKLVLAVRLLWIKRYVGPCERRWWWRQIHGSARAQLVQQVAAQAARLFLLETPGRVSHGLRQTQRIWYGNEPLYEAEAHVQAGSALGSPPVISMVKSTVWPV